MITQSLYLNLQQLLIEDLTGHGVSLSEIITAESQAFIKPYVLVVHRPSRRGFYLDREYRHIIDVSNCQEPKNPIEVTKDHLCASPNLPDWTKGYRWEDFITFWLY